MQKCLEVKQLLLPLLPHHHLHLHLQHHNLNLNSQQHLKIDLDLSFRIQPIRRHFFRNPDKIQMSRSRLLRCLKTYLAILFSHLLSKDLNLRMFSVVLVNEDRKLLKAAIEIGETAMFLHQCKETQNPQAISQAQEAARDSKEMPICL